MLVDNSYQLFVPPNIGFWLLSLVFENSFTIKRCLIALPRMCNSENLCFRSKQFEQNSSNGKMRHNVPFSVPLFSYWIFRWTYAKPLRAHVRSSIGWKQISLLFVCCKNFSNKIQLCIARLRESFSILMMWIKSLFTRGLLRRKKK